MKLSSLALILFVGLFAVSATAQTGLKQDAIIGTILVSYTKKDILDYAKKEGYKTIKQNDGLSHSFEKSAKDNKSGKIWKDYLTVQFDEAGEIKFLRATYESTEENPFKKEELAVAMLESFFKTAFKERSGNEEEIEGNYKYIYTVNPSTKIEYIVYKTDYSTSRFVVEANIVRN